MSELPPLLTLPYELRDEIYELVLDQRLGYFPKFYSSISFFCSLNRFSDWTSKGDPFLLKQIQNVTVHVFDDSLLPIGEELASSKELRTGSRKPRFWKTVSAHQFHRSNAKLGPRNTLRSRILSALSLAKADLKPGFSKNTINSTRDAFMAINEVKKLWVLFSRINMDPEDSTHPISRRAYPVEQVLVLDILSTACQRVQDFTVFSGFTSFDYLGRFQDLCSLRFSGYSKSTPDETLQILQSLKELDTLVIYCYPEGYDMDHSIITSRLPESISVTPQVVASMNPLKHFQISHMSSIVPSPHLTVAFLQALRTHLATLRILQLSSDYALTVDIVEELLSLLAASKITDLRIRLRVPKQFEDRDPMNLFLETCKDGEASTREANVDGLIHLVMTASGMFHHITHINLMCMCCIYHGYRMDGISI